jgi:membrane fusion protein (multidrug efflux system)
VTHKAGSFKKWFQSKNLRFRLSFVLLCGLSLIAALHFYHHSLVFQMTDDAFIEGPITPVSAKVAAHVLVVHVTDNQEVKEGDLLLELDARDYLTKLDMARAAVQMAEAEAVQARTDVERYSKLVETDEISKQQLDMALLRSATGDAKLALAKSNFEQAELQVSYTKVTAPVSGHVTRKSAEVGAFVAPGQALMALVTQERWVVANFKETQLALMRAGQPVEIKIDTYPGRKWKGKVDSIQRGTGSRFSLLPPENATGNYVKVVQRVPVKILLEESADPKRPLAVGMSAEPEVKVR